MKGTKVVVFCSVGDLVPSKSGQLTGQPLLHRAMFRHLMNVKEMRHRYLGKIGLVLNAIVSSWEYMFICTRLVGILDDPLVLEKSCLI